MGNTLQMGFTFAEVHGRECILIPGKFIVKESLEELGVLREYMTKYHQWIGREFATRFALSLIAFSLPLACFQARFQIDAAHPCCWYCEDWQLGNRSHFKKWDCWESNLHHLLAGESQGMGWMVQEFFCRSLWSLYGWVSTWFFFRSTLWKRFLILLGNKDKNTTANQTLFIRRIALRSDIPLGKKAWAPTYAPRTFIQRLRATLNSDDSWILVNHNQIPHLCTSSFLFLSFYIYSLYLLRSGTPDSNATRWCIWNEI